MQEAGHKGWDVILYLVPPLGIGPRHKLGLSGAPRAPQPDSRVFRSSNYVSSFKVGDGSILWATLITAHAICPHMAEQFSWCSCFWFTRLDIICHFSSPWFRWAYLPSSTFTHTYICTWPCVHLSFSATNAILESSFALSCNQIWASRTLKNPLKSVECEMCFGRHFGL